MKIFLLIAVCLCSEVEPQPLSEPYNPSVIKPTEGGDSVFLFTPASYQSVQSKLKHIGRLLVFVILILDSVILMLLQICNF